MTHEIRAATPDDVSEIRALYVRSWRAAYESELEPELLDAVSEQRARDVDWATAIADSDAVVLVGLTDAGAIVGVAQANEPPGSPRDLPELTMLYIDPESFGTGLATALHAEALRWVARREHTGVRLRVVDSHGRARAFYEREGWTLDPMLEPEPTDIATVVYYARQLTSPQVGCDG